MRSTILASMVSAALAATATTARRPAGLPHTRGPKPATMMLTEADMTKALREKGLSAEEVEILKRMTKDLSPKEVNRLYEMTVQLPLEQIKQSIQMQQQMENMQKTGGAPVLDLGDLKGQLGEFNFEELNNELAKFLPTAKEMEMSMKAMDEQFKKVEKVMKKQAGAQKEATEKLFEEVKEGADSTDAALIDELGELQHDMNDQADKAEQGEQMTGEAMQKLGENMQKVAEVSEKLSPEKKKQIAEKGFEMMQKNSEDMVKALLKEDGKTDEEIDAEMKKMKEVQAQMKEQLKLVQDEMMQMFAKKDGLRSIKDHKEQM